VRQLQRAPLFPSEQKRLFYRSGTMMRGTLPPPSCGFIARGVVRSYGLLRPIMSCGFED
jgi:hypothetical protein